MSQTSEIRDIVQVNLLTELEEDTETNVYVEHGGNFRRAAPEIAREGIGLGGLVVSNGMVCVELDEE